MCERGHEFTGICGRVSVSPEMNCTNEPGLLSSEGKIGPDVPEEGAAVEITLQMLQEECQFTAEHSFYVNVFPKSGEAFWNRLEAHLKEIEEDTRVAGRYMLPDRFEGKKPAFFSKKKRSRAAGFFFCFCLGQYWQQQEKKRESEKQDNIRRAKIEQEYPEMISGMTMLIGAGMTISGAFKRIAGEYGRQRQEKEQAAL